MKFNTQVCTTIEQAERLLALGLKKETADMYLTRHSIVNNGTPMFFVGTTYNPSTVLFSKEDFPAWSLHRLIEMMPAFIDLDYDNERYDNRIFFSIHGGSVSYNNDEVDDYIGLEYKENLYDDIINNIEWLIKNNHFNEQYLDKSL